jgi:hypothetical protein
MRNYHIIARLKEWALQDSNLRPSDYESVSAPNNHNDLRARRSEDTRQTATSLATSRQQDATHSATHFQGGRYGSVAMRKRTACPPTSQQPNPTVPDLYANSRIFLAWRWCA